MGDIFLQYREQLLAFAEDGYRQFSVKLNPGIENILGVRTPKIKALAKELAKDDWRGYFARDGEIYFEELMLRAVTIGQLKEAPDTVFAEIERFLPCLNGWALCDSLCAGLKIARKEPERMWDLVRRCAESDKPFYVRFAVVMMLCHFIDDAHIDEALRRCGEIESDEYYVKMALAWAVSVCFVKQREKTLAFLTDCPLDDFTYNKSLQKIRESYRVSDADKELLRAMKR